MVLEVTGIASEMPPVSTAGVVVVSLGLVLGRSKPPSVLVGPSGRAISVLVVVFPPGSVGANPKSLVILLSTPPRAEVNSRGSVGCAGSVEVVVAVAGSSDGEIDVEFAGESIARGSSSAVLDV